MIPVLRRVAAAFGYRPARHCPWLTDALLALDREQRGIARAARSVVSGGGQETLEDLLCRAEGLGERLADLCERVAAIAALRALQAHAVQRDDPGVAA